jgi:alkanesulfonate monooxygenase SsuD/methylene tetrahydromethanopterin reductase-like flavin-dependent oxidoreductase (luciferase family)
MTVEFGLKLPDHVDVVTFARQAESMNLDFLFQGEHVFFHGSVTNTLIDLSFAAAATDRVKLLSAATLVPLYPAALLAKMAATIAVNSKGRFNLGVGVGGDFPAEFEACGVSIAGRGRATDAALELMTRLWRGDAIGPFKSPDSEEFLTLDPLPPGRAIPLWVGGRSSATIDRAVRFGDWWMPYMYSLKKFERDRAQLVERSSEAGRECPKSALHALAVLGDTKQQAIEAGTRILATVYGQPFDEATVERLCIVGSSSDVAEQIHRFAEAGAEAVCLNLLADPHDYDRRMEQLCADVMPEVRTSTG